MKTEYNPKNPDVFRQVEIKPPTPPELNIVQQNPGTSTIKEGSFQSKNFAPSRSGWRLGSEGGAEFQNINIRGTDIGVKPGDNIQDAIDLVSNNGGGFVRLSAGTYYPTTNIEIKEGVRLIGSGRDITYIDFNGAAFGVTAIGTSSAFIKNIGVLDLTVNNSNHTSGIDLQFCEFFRIENIEVSSCNQVGISIKYSRNFFINNSESSSNTGDNWYFGSNADSTSRFTVSNCTANNSGADGFHVEHLTSGTTGTFYYSFINCSASSNAGDGFHWDGAVSTGNGYARIIGCLTSLNTGYEINVESSSYYLRFIGNYFSGPIFVFDGGHVLIGNSYDQTSSISFGNFIIDTQYHEHGIEDKEIIKLTNKSGSSVAAGDVVILDSSAISGGNFNFTTTTVAGSNKVVGIALESIANNASGGIQIKGQTTILKVDGTTDIAIGDFLSTFTTAGIAKKAVAGETAFAIAYEAYTTNDSAGVIDALLISPRLI